MNLEKIQVGTLAEEFAAMPKSQQRGRASKRVKTSEGAIEISPVVSYNKVSEVSFWVQTGGIISANGEGFGTG